jgi:hypothetical protein
MKFIIHLIMDRPGSCPIQFVLSKIAATNVHNTVQLVNGIFLMMNALTATTTDTNP